jgi:glycosyltransferase A (GT-A) superfamily protein (DUF2064 family)
VSLTLLVIAKEPRPGRVKTRLTPPFTPREAATLAEAALVDTLRAVAATPARRRVLVLDGAPGPWLPDGFDVVRQCAGTLDERLAAAFAGCDGPALLIGMDTPQVTPALLTVDFGDCDAYFGPAEDGGFWALGLAEPDPELLRGVPMSTHTTGAVQRERLVGAGLRVRDLPCLRDVDTAADATAVAAAAPEGVFAAELERLGTVTAQAAGHVPRPYAGEGTVRMPGPIPEQVPGQVPGQTAGQTAGQTEQTEQTTEATVEETSGFVAGLKAARAAGLPAGIGTGRETGPAAGQRGAGR